MAAKSRFFQAGVSAALAIAFLVLASPARAEPVTLICQNESNSITTWGKFFTLRVDYDRKVVELMRGDGGGVLLSSTVTVTESDVRWMFDNSAWDYASQGAQGFMGGLDRNSGHGWASFASQQVLRYTMSGPCRRATQKF